MTEASIQPFRIAIDEAQLHDLACRLRATRWPEPEPVADWSQGIPLDYLQDVCRYWAEGYDWRSREARINAFPQFIVPMEGLDIHIIHATSAREDALPLLISHGWPGSVVEFLDILGPLAAPQEHGAPDAPAFHVVCPSLPGFGFSDKPLQTGWGVEKIAQTWDRLMERLGYSDYLAQGGDWGAAITTAIGLQDRGRCRSIHVNMPLAAPPPSAREHPTEADKRAFAAIQHYSDFESGYSTQQKTRPQTLGYGLVDSPAGQAAWILEKFQAWTDCDGHPENALSRDQLLDNVMLYWLPATGASSARIYWESFDSSFGGSDATVSLPTACSIFPREIVPIPKSWAEQRYDNIVHWNELDRGGHFAAFEQPDLFVGEMRAWARALGR